MKLLQLIFFLSVIIYIKADCSDKQEIECPTTDYQSYVECIRSRSKRSADCYEGGCEESNNCVDSCDECNCNSCSYEYEDCQNSCENCCSSCCSNSRGNYRHCETSHCCHKVCHATCKSSKCRSSCRKSCYNNIKNTKEIQKEKEVIIQRTDGSSSGGSTSVKDAHNITTIIHLNNIINSTNLIDVPIVLNNTNINNITLDSPIIQHGHRSQQITGQDKDGCCNVISPRQCVPTEKYPYARCFHYRTRQCGSFCTTPIVHAEPRQICNAQPRGQVSCQQQVAYIPQPTPRCVYQSAWPYVSCGIPREAACGGCYSHYFDQNSKAHLQCSSHCYDDGFGTGPYYRQGPFYRPGYAHSPYFDYNLFGNVPNLGGFEQSLDTVPVPLSPPLNTLFNSSEAVMEPNPNIDPYYNAIGENLGGDSNVIDYINGLRMNLPGLENAESDTTRTARDAEIKIDPNTEHPIESSTLSKGTDEDN